MPNSIREDRSVPMELRDGTVLRGDIYRLNDKRKRPAILMRTRYDRLGWEIGGNSVFMPVIEAVMAGYVIVFQNVRGTYDSEGEQILDDPFLTVEGPGGYDSIEWIASQSWCDGNVGMAGGPMGGSYLPEYRRFPGANFHLVRAAGMETATQWWGER